MSSTLTSVHNALRVPLSDEETARKKAAWVTALTALAPTFGKLSAEARSLGYESDCIDATEDGGLEILIKEASKTPLRISLLWEAYPPGQLASGHFRIIRPSCVLDQLWDPQSLQPEMFESLVVQQFWAYLRGL